uniref:Mediator of RNA polymerase II transcription subunit 17 n=1 Tax=Bionectria ochroleuca TaxID=29856 RepID=A0A8H7TUF5_BIOOC
MPQERHTLGVRFGFSESAPEFKNNGLAPMRRGDDGSVQLDCGRLGGVSERIVVTYERDGEVVGRSSVPAQTDQSAPLEKRVLEARNTLFSQELWHELNREARNLAAYDVRPEGSSLTCKLDESTKLRIDLVTLDSTPSTSDSSPGQNVAETISQVLHLLLCYSHTQNELGRTRPIPPHLPRSRGQQIYPLLRPIIARASHLQGVKSSSKYIGTLVQCLKNAGINASFSLHTPPPFTLQSQPNLANQPSPPTSSSATCSTLPTSHSRWLYSQMHHSLSAPEQPSTLSQAPTSTSSSPFFIPTRENLPPFREGYPDVDTLSEYIRTATCRLLAEQFLAEIPDGLWVPNIKGDSLRPADNDESELRFIILEDEPNSPTLVVKSTKVAGQSSNTEKWEWRSSSTESESTSLADCVNRVIGKKAS